MARGLLTRGRMKWLGVALVLVVCGCGPRTGARVDPLAPRTAVVGEELVVPLHVEGAGASLELSYDSDIADLKTRALRPTLTVLAGGDAVLRWTPLAGDLGDHVLLLRATAFGIVSGTRLQVTVIAGAGQLAFREPVGEGTTLDTTRAPCADVPILIEDPGAAEVKLERGAVFSDGATLTQEGPLAGRLEFCPSVEQQRSGTIYPFSLVASDASGARAEKRYTIVLGQLAVTPPPTPAPTPTPTMCDPAAPVITHIPHGDITTAGNLHLFATVSDPSGIYGATVFWSLDPPADPQDPDLSAMNATDMVLTSGDAVQGGYAATIPNPVYADPPGTTATIYYLIGASDADDRVMGCPYHVAWSPTSGVYSFTVKRSKAQ